MNKFETQMKEEFKKLQTHDGQADTAWLETTRRRLDVYTDLHPQPQHHHTFEQVVASVFTRPLLMVGIAALVLLGGCTGTVWAAWYATPGDVLYPVKLATEKAVIVLQNDDTSRAQLHMVYAEKRLLELAETTRTSFVTSTVLEQVVADMETHVREIDTYVQTRTDLTEKAAATLRVETFTKMQEGRLEHIERTLADTAAPTIARVRTLNDTQRNHTITTLRTMHEQLQQSTSTNNVILTHEVATRLEAVDKQKSIKLDSQAADPTRTLEQTDLPQKHDRAVPTAPETSPKPAATSTSTQEIKPDTDTPAATSTSASTTTPSTPPPNDTPSKEDESDMKEEQEEDDEERTDTQTEVHKTTISDNIQPTENEIDTTHTQDDTTSDIAPQEPMGETDSVESATTTSATPTQSATTTVLSNTHTTTVLNTVTIR